VERYIQRVDRTASLQEARREIARIVAFGEATSSIGPRRLSGTSTFTRTRVVVSPYYPTVKLVVNDDMVATVLTRDPAADTASPTQPDP
jgi:hypothetical protein